MKQVFFLFFSYKIATLSTISSKIYFRTSYIFYYGIILRINPVSYYLTYQLKDYNLFHTNCCETSYLNKQKNVISEF